MSTSAVDDHGAPRPRHRASVEALLAAKRTQPIRSVEDLVVDTFASGDEVEEFLAFTYAERHRDLA